MRQQRSSLFSYLLAKELSPGCVLFNRERNRRHSVVLRESDEVNDSAVNVDSKCGGGGCFNIFLTKYRH